MFLNGSCGQYRDYVLSGSTPRVCWELRSAGLVLLNTAGGDYKPTPIQCLSDVGPASPVLASIHSVIVNTSC